MLDQVKRGMNMPNPQLAPSPTAQASRPSLQSHPHHVPGTCPVPECPHEQRPCLSSSLLLCGAWPNLLHVTHTKRLFFSLCLFFSPRVAQFLPDPPCYPISPFHLMFNTRKHVIHLHLPPPSFLLLLSPQ